MSRIPPANIRQTSQTLCYPAIGASNYYYGLQLKQHLAIAHAIQKLGRVLVFPTAPIKRHQLQTLQPAVLPITSQLRAQTYTSFMLTNSIPWFMGKLFSWANAWQASALLFENINRRKAQSSKAKVASNHTLPLFPTVGHQGKAYDQANIVAKRCGKYTKPYTRFALAITCPLQMLLNKSNFTTKAKTVTSGFAAPLRPLSPLAGLFKPFRKSKEPYRLLCDQSRRIKRLSFCSSGLHGADLLIAWQKRPEVAIPPLPEGFGSRLQGASNDKKGRYNKKKTAYKATLKTSTYATPLFVRLAFGLVAQKVYNPKTNTLTAPKVASLTATKFKASVQKKFYDFLFLEHLRLKDGQNAEKEGSKKLYLQRVTTMSDLSLKKSSTIDPWLKKYPQISSSGLSSRKVLAKKRSAVPKSQRGAPGRTIDHCFQQVGQPIETPTFALSYGANRPVNLNMFAFLEGRLPHGVKQTSTASQNWTNATKARWKRLPAAKAQNRFLSPKGHQQQGNFKKSMLRPYSRHNQIYSAGANRLKSAVRFDLQIGVSPQNTAPFLGGQKLETGRPNQLTTVRPTVSVRL